VLDVRGDDLVNRIEQSLHLADFEVKIPGDPVPQGRGKAARWRSRGGREGIAVRDPQKSRDWKGRAQVLMLAELERQGLDVPLVPAGEAVELIVVALYRCPRSEERKREPRPLRPHLKRGDLDNIVKAVKDAGTGVLWVDDSQVWRVSAEKLIAAQGEPGRVRIAVVRETAEGVAGGSA
jgi:Holliday junction resolvase RusA-like endonuclease